MAANRITYQDMMNPLFLHPSNNASSITVDKLQGSSDYRAWKRSMEINLSSKRKPGFLAGTIPVPTDDPLKTEMWETCNNMIIAWITSNVSPTIKRSIMYMTSARVIWLNLEKRFALTNGSRKYKLNKEVYETKQNSLSVTEYYTSLKTIWEELDALNVLPTVAAPQPDVVKLLDTINAQREEGRLFQFLNGLSDQFNVQRSQMLMLDPLPSVEAACAAFEQEEAQKAVLNPSKPLLEIMAMNTKTQYQRPTCTACKGKGHTAEKCWTVVGYPKWHSRHNANASAKPRSVSFSQSKPVSSRMVSAAQVVNDASSSSGVLFTQQQLEQLALLMPQLQQVTKESDTDEELDMHFSGIISSNTSSIKNDWIIDSGASDHMTACLNSLHDIVPVAKTHQIKLPTGDSVLITHTVDDHSRHCWVYLLSHKSDALVTLESFLKYVQNHFDSTIKVIMSDNALEFTSAACKQFFSDHGIVHQTSCVNRPQQNARAERKNRHILELARALRFQAGLPINFWGDCVLTAVYLINRLPTLLKYKSH
ncbi:hypothetical protein AgCh_031420 [Apium graveolens]